MALNTLTEIASGAGAALVIGGGHRGGSEFLRQYFGGRHPIPGPVLVIDPEQGRAARTAALWRERTGLRVIAQTAFAEDTLPSLPRPSFLVLAMDDPLSVADALRWADGCTVRWQILCKPPRPWSPIVGFAGTIPPRGDRALRRESIDLLYSQAGPRPTPSRHVAVDALDRVGLRRMRERICSRSVAAIGALASGGGGEFRGGLEFFLGEACMPLSVLRGRSAEDTEETARRAWAAVSRSPRAEGTERAVAVVRPADVSIHILSRHRGREILLRSIAMSDRAGLRARHTD